MSIPDKCTVLVVGGGPSGSYTAAALAREGVDTVLLEAEVFPRYHIGESMLASMRHFLRFIDLDSTFDQHGFKQKNGAAFKLNGTKREGYTDFITSGGPNNYTWNLVRSESDDLIFRHASKSGAKIFDGVKVNAINFVDTPQNSGESPPTHTPNPGLPISASYTNTSTKESGVVAFEYLVDATGRAGLLNTKYLKNRIYNRGLKNIAIWSYWNNTQAYGEGTYREDSPFFEALTDESGWAWLIPLHNGTTSVGIVMNQALANSKKKAYASTKDFYLATLQTLVPSLSQFLEGGQLATEEIKSASDYSYRSSSYALSNTRIVGDAGSFIDPFFSSGVHLAFTNAVSAAATICAVLRGDCDRVTAARWHSQRVADGYERFMLVVLSAYRQMRRQAEPVLSDIDEDNFDKAFASFRSVIQGNADISDNVTVAEHAELEKMMVFCAHAFEPSKRVEESARPIEKAETSPSIKEEEIVDRVYTEKTDQFHAKLIAEEEEIFKRIRARGGKEGGNTVNIDGNFRTDVIDGLAICLERGNLGLVPA